MNNKRKFNLLTLLRFINCNKVDNYNKSNCKRLRLVHKQVRPSNFISASEYSKYITGSKKLTHDKIYDFSLNSAAFANNIVFALESTSNLLVFLSELKSSVDLPNLMMVEIDKFISENSDINVKQNTKLDCQAACQLIENIFITACQYSNGNTYYEPISKSWKMLYLKEINLYDEIFIERDIREEQIIITNSGECKKRNISREIVFNNPVAKPFSYIEKRYIRCQLNALKTENNYDDNLIKSFIATRYQNFELTLSFDGEKQEKQNSNFFDRIQYHILEEDSQILVMVKYFSDIIANSYRIAYNYGSVEPFHPYQNTYTFRVDFPTLQFEHRHELITSDQYAMQSSTDKPYWQLKYAIFFRFKKWQEKYSENTKNKACFSSRSKLNKLVIKPDTIVTPGEGYCRDIVPNKC